PGLATEASVGFGLGNGLRLEVEGFYNYNHLHKLEGTPFATMASGENEEYGGMVNALYDFDIGMPFIFPYVGVGVGYQWTTWHNVHASGINFPASLYANDTAGSFAYQGIAGLSFPIPSLPGLSLTAEYRLVGTPDNNMPMNAVVTTHFPTTVTHGSLQVHNEFAHQAMFGLRYAFGVAPPPPPPPPPVVTPAPAPARTYLVFFDWDRADLTARARQIIREAADASRHVAYTRIEVNGYTDRSGTPQYNLRLSIRRARSVEAELIRDGVPRNVIDIHGYGETHPLVPTAPGVREPQNRRVEIILR
ncbi:MAG: OmpA family protein, partial [Acetobacteraceae bacterium]